MSENCTILSYYSKVGGTVKLNYNIEMDARSKWIVADSAQSELYVQEIGDFRAGKSYFTEREALGSYLLKYTIDGRGVLEYNGVQYTLEPGQFFLIDCWEHQRYYTDPKAGSWHMLWVHFYGPAAEKLYQRFLACGSGNVGFIGQDSPIAEALCNLLQLCDTPPTATSDLRQQSMLQMILSECIDSVSTESEKDGHYVQMARDYITAHFAENITLEELGQLTHVSRYYLQRLFCQQYGTSPLEYQQRLRLTYAKELLRSTDLSIADIAAQVGFSSAGYFIRFFRKLDSITPAAYRRQWQQLPLNRKQDC